MDRPVPYAPPPVIGHRGAAHAAPENTLAAFRQCLAEGVSWVECDAKLSADGVPVLLHDDILKRTTNGGRRAAAETPLADLVGLDAGSWFSPSFAGEPVPTLEQAVAFLAERDMGANIEVKPCSGREWETGFRVAEAILAHWPHDGPPPVVSSFSRESLAAVAEAAPQLPLALLCWAVPDDWREIATALGCVALHWRDRTVTRRLADATREAGFGFSVYTVNRPRRAVTLWEWGANAIITDQPGRLMAVHQDWIAARSGAG